MKRKRRLSHKKQPSTTMDNRESLFGTFLRELSEITSPAVEDMDFSAVPDEEVLGNAYCATELDYYYYFNDNN